MTHVMLDLETFGLRPGCAVRSIGAVVFDPLGRVGLGDEFYCNIDRLSCEAAGLTVEPDTVRWWAEQDALAKKALELDPLALAMVVQKFSQWWSDVNGEQVWSQGSNFDGPIWEAACRAVGRREPWKFYNTRDTRTVYEVFDLQKKDMPLRRGVAHDAMDDVKHQVACLQAAMRRR